MWNSFTEILPPPLAAGLVITGGIGWAIAPEMTRRFGELDAVPACVAGATAEARGSSVEALKRHFASSLLGAAAQQLGDTPLGQVAGELARGMEEPRASVKDSSSTARCRCLLGAAASDSQVRFDATVWVLSLRFIEGSGISDLSGHMGRKAREGECGVE